MVPANTVRLPRTPHTHTHTHTHTPHFRPQVKYRSRKHLDQLQAHTELNLRPESWLGSVSDDARRLHVLKLRKKADMGLPSCLFLEEVKLLFCNTDGYLL